MKRLIAILILALIAPLPAHAEETGAWVKVDANGNAIGQAIVCTAAVCGDSSSLYNKMTLNAGEQYVLQASALPDGNVAGIGAGNELTSVKIDLETKVWTVVTTNIDILPKTKENPKPKSITTITTQEFTANQAPWVTGQPVPTSIIQAEALIIAMETITKTKKKKKAKNVQNNK
jgi:hypothetical protein